ncbi:Uncharacterised protein [Vibrio cholerae]|nr:Uncharacterised protein [Vibrio cholerae]
MLTVSFNIRKSWVDPIKWSCSIKHFTLRFLQSRLCVVLHFFGCG